MKIHRDKQSVEQFMTYNPKTIHSGLPIKKAEELMKKHKVRHLPVQFAGHLVGVISDRDLKFASSFDKKGEMLIDDIMTPDPYAVPIGTPIGEVVEKMATNLYGCTMVQQDDGRVVGIFTALDGLRLIGEQLNGPKRALKRRKTSSRKGVRK